MPFESFKDKLMDVKSSEHSAMLKRAMGLINLSRADMSTYYDRWDRHDYTFRSIRRPDREDFKLVSRGQEKKMIVPLTFSQVMTFVAFSVMSITQNRRFFELEPVENEINPLTEPLELLLERDLRRNRWTTFLVQFFLDIGRFSLGAAEVGYVEESHFMRIPKTETMVGAFGVPTEVTTTEFQSIPTFIGNKIFAVSPYRFFPDTRLPISRYQEGEFCGSEDVFSYSVLRNMESTLGLFNLDDIPRYTEVGYNRRREISRVDLGGSIRDNPNLGTGVGDHDESAMVRTGSVVVTKGVFTFNPKHFKVNEEKGKLGTEDFPIRYIVWYANDRTIIRFEEAQYLHGQLPYICSQYIPDQHVDINEALSDICESITHFITWKMNAHIASQRNSVLSRWAVDPAGVDPSSLTDTHKPYIVMKKNIGLTGTGIDRYVKQFVTQDVTANVMTDIEQLNVLLEKVTGFSAMMQGQHSAGRRSATQDRVVAQGAAARGKTTVGCIWDSAFEPLGRQLISNNRQEMDFQRFFEIVGKTPTTVINPDTGVAYTVEETFALFKADPLTIAKAEHFFIFDATLPSEKSFLAQSLQEILVTILSNPEVAQILGYGQNEIRELFNQIYLLRGVTPARATLPKATPAAGSITALPSPNVAASGTV